jgi:hypothetical protein
MPRRSWEPGKATVVERKAMLLGSGDNHTRFKFVLDVEVPNKPAFRTTLKSPSWMPDKFFTPWPGQVVPVLADAERQKAKWDRSPEANAAAFKDYLSRPRAIGSWTPPGQAADPPSSATQLERLAKLKEQRALTDAEYERARKGVEQG